MEMTREDLQQLTELFEDTAEYYCDQNIISGQKLWTVLECLATAKLAELNGEIDGWMQPNWYSDGDNVSYELNGWNSLWKQSYGGCSVYY